MTEDIHPPKLCFEILSSEITNKTARNKHIEKPFTVENIRKVGLKLKIKSNCNQTVKIYLKYVDPKNKYLNEYSKIFGKIVYHDKTEPFVETITHDTTMIDISGWGNTKWCSFEVGEHKVEVHVDDFRVFTKSFVVDWSPKKKDKLKKELELLQIQLTKVKKFKWGRLPKAKQKEVRQLNYKITETINILRNKTDMNYRTVIA